VTGQALSILLVGDYPDDPRLGSSKVASKLRDEFTALGHACDVVWSAEIGSRPAWRQIRQLVSPWMAARAIARREGRHTYDVIDVASADGLIVGLLNLIPDRDRAAYVCRSHGLEQLNYDRMVADAREGLRAKSWIRRVWYPATRLSQVAAAARLADALLLINDVDRQYALDRGWQPPDRVTVVPHGISSRFVAEAPPPDAPRGAGMLFCGTWDYVKGTPYVCAAMRQLHDAGTPARLTVLGPGYPADRVLADFDPAIRPFVTVIDRVPEDRVMAEYRRHDALLFTSTYEGFGLVVIEGMSQRLPVIATPVGCAASLVRDGETGYRVPVRDAAALAAAVRLVLADPGDARRRADNAREQVAGMTWRATAERTIAVYEGALERVRRRH
jgi:glycosyltransferase involved in cell wall biosynthesis